MIIHLTDEERDILLRLVHREISDLGTEIRHTATADYRDDLKDYKHRLRDLSERLSASETETKQ